MGHCQSLYVQTDTQALQLDWWGSKSCAPELPGWRFVATWNKQGHLMSDSGIQCILDNWPEDGVWLLRSWYYKASKSDTTPQGEVVEERITREHARDLLQTRTRLMIVGAPE